MSPRIRSFVILIGLSLLFIALLVLTAKPLPHLSTTLPLVPASGNVPYFLLMRVLQKLFGTGTGVLLAANGALMLGIAWSVFRAGGILAEPRHRLLGAAAAMLLFELSPLAIILPLTLGFLGGHLMVPLFLLMFVGVMRTVEHWSVFMRSIVLALAWSLLLWVHIPTALLVLLAMIPWVLYNRRPLPALGIFLTIFFLGTVFFSVLWMAGCALSQRWFLVQAPLNTLCEVGTRLHQSLSWVWGGGGAVWTERTLYVAAWLSPFFLVYGLWVTGSTLTRMLRERRASTADLAALIALAALGVVLGTPGKDSLPGAWYLLLILVLWSPLVAQGLAVKENFYSRGFRLTFGVGFFACAGLLVFLHRGALEGLLIPNSAALSKLVAGVLLAGAVSYGVLKKHPLTFENRAQALLAGSSLAYFVMMDFQLLR